MKRFLVGVVIVLIAAAYLGGYWPEHQRRASLESEIPALRAQVDELDAQVRLGKLLGRLLLLTEAVQAMNYGQAQTLSSDFFDAVAAEASRTSVSSMRTTLEGILSARDGLTSALARGDQNAIEPLRRLQFQLREALGYQIPAPQQPVAQ